MVDKDDANFAREEAQRLSKPYEQYLSEVLHEALQQRQAA